MSIIERDTYGVYSINNNTEAKAINTACLSWLVPSMPVGVCLSVHVPLVARHETLKSATAAVSMVQSLGLRWDWYGK